MRRLLLAVAASSSIASAQYCTATAGTANDRTCTVSGVTLAAGIEIRLKSHVANTGPVRFNLNGTGLKSVLREQNQAMTANDWLTNAVVTIVYDGTNWQWQSQSAKRLIGGDSSTVVFTENGADRRLDLAANLLDISNLSGTAFLMREEFVVGDGAANDGQIGQYNFTFVPQGSGTWDFHAPVSGEDTGHHFTIDLITGITSTSIASLRSNVISRIGGLGLLSGWQTTAVFKTPAVLSQVQIRWGLSNATLNAFNEAVYLEFNNSSSCAAPWSGTRADTLFYLRARKDAGTIDSGPIAAAGLTVQPDTWYFARLRGPAPNEANLSIARMIFSGGRAVREPFTPEVSTNVVTTQFAAGVRPFFQIITCNTASKTLTVDKLELFLP